MVRRSSCAARGDPLAGVHAVFATLLALRRRDETGQGVLVEATMVEAALNAAVEAVFEHDLHGVVVGRAGNRRGRRHRRASTAARATTRGWRSRSRTTSSGRRCVRT